MSKKKAPDWQDNFEQVHDGVSFNPLKYDECCDCGLIHRLKYEVFVDGKRIKGAEIRIKAWRHQAATKFARAKARVRIFKS